MRLWLFADWSVPTPGHISMYSDMGFSDIVLGVSTKRNEFKLNYSKKRWADASEQIKKKKMKTHLMVWSVREHGFLEETFRVLGPFAKEIDATSLLFDCEADHHTGSMNPSLFANAALDLSKESNLMIGVTGLDTIHNTVVPMRNVCRYILPQAYSFWKPARLCNDGKHWSHTSHTFPGPQQQRAFESWWVPAPDKDFVMGLACYWGDRPKLGVAPAITDEQSMRYAAVETVSIWWKTHKTKKFTGEFWGAAYWSAKHLRGVTEEKQARRKFISTLAKS